VRGTADRRNAAEGAEVKPSLQLCVAVAVFALTVALGLGWFWRDGSDEPDYGTPPSARSADLAADLKLMWGTRDTASTDEAIAAAERVFATVEFVGLTRSEVISLLGDPKKSSDSRYNFPFYPASRRALVYRFDNGCGGCQYNVWFGWNGRVRRVQYLAIE
jgi:hypothetical protein